VESRTRGVVRGRGAPYPGALVRAVRMGREEPSMDPKHDTNEARQLAESPIEGALALQTEPTPPAVTREQRRSRRKRAIRARTISVKRMTKRELELGRLLYPEVDESERPRTRADCGNGARPCPFVSCKHHLYLDVSARTGAIKLNFPDLDVWEMAETCALDVADRGGTTLEEVGAIMNLTRERIRQVEVKGLAKLVALRDMMALRDYVDEGTTGKRRLPVVEKDHDEAVGEPDEDDDLEGADDATGSVAIDGAEVDVESFAAVDLEID
jgi:Sigma-70, region 4